MLPQPCTTAAPPPIVSRREHWQKVGVLPYERVHLARILRVVLGLEPPGVAVEPRATVICELKVVRAQLSWGFNGQRSALSQILDH